MGTPVTMSNMKDAITSFLQETSLMRGGTTVHLPDDTKDGVDSSVLPKDVFSATGLWLNEAYVHCPYTWDTTTKQERTKSSSTFISS